VSFANCCEIARKLYQSRGVIIENLSIFAIPFSQPDDFAETESHSQRPWKNEGKSNIYDMFEQHFAAAAALRQK